MVWPHRDSNSCRAFNVGYLFGSHFQFCPQMEKLIFRVAVAGSRMSLVHSRANKGWAMKQAKRCDEKTGIIIIIEDRSSGNFEIWDWLRGIGEVIQRAVQFLRDRCDLLHYFLVVWAVTLTHKGKFLFISFLSFFLFSRLHWSKHTPLNWFLCYLLAWFYQ